MASPQEEQSYPFVDIYDEDEADKAFLMSKPTCFLILGKPGIGKKTLATKIAQIWKCTLIDVFELIDENVSARTEYGLKIKELLYQGQSIPEELIVKMLLNKMETPEVFHFGYVLCDFPCLSEEYMTITEQIEIIRNLKLKPDFLINIKCPDYDLCQRLSGQRQLYTTGQVFQRDEWDPDIIEKRRKKKKESNKAGEEEEEAEEEEEEEEAAEAAADQLMLTEILPHLVQRPEDFLENVQRKIDMYRDTVLHPLEELMAEQDSQYLIELDGNKSPDELFTSVISRLQSMGLRNGAIITRLQSAEEEILEGLENDEIFRALAAYKLVAPRYRWWRSKWGRICPVALKDGEIVMGSPDLAVSFLGKMYTLSSEEALKTFMLNPRPFLLLPMPLPPCKVLVIGPPLSGKSTLCAAIANHYMGKVLDMDVLLKGHLEEARSALIEQIRAEATAAGIAKVKEKIEMERLFREQVALGAQEASSDKELEDFEESFQVDEKSSSEQPSASASRSQRAGTVDGCTLFSHPVTKRFLKGLLRLYPPVKAPAPLWDLPLVLRQLTRRPFEPLATCQLKLLAWNSPYLSFLPDGVRLVPDISFLPKVVSEFHLQSEVFLPDFYPDPKSPEDRLMHTLDVKRALLFYLSRTRPTRQTPKLFVSYAAPRVGTPITAQRLSKWI
ncbi:PREDICTED: adenylate kinase 9-like, partial [Gekko japonicus]|uniref:Adenylate kinase 9-like n=1 Tax=Gekko japonicus TaxID=146911 RepID=A0ABM1KZF3_GEKJA